MRAIPAYGITALCALAALIALLATPSQAQTQYVEGTHYQPVANVTKTKDPKKIEIMEIFWYGCPHCNQFRPLFSKWEKAQADDVVVDHSPAIWNKPMIVHAHIFYTAKALRLEKKMHKELFDAMHIERKKLVKKNEIFALFEKHGVTREQFDKIFDSFGVRSQVKQATARARGYGITGTPEVIVNGKYRVSGRMVPTQADVLKVVSYLVEKERAAIPAQ